jgi:hypothetical protein
MDLASFWATFSQSFGHPEQIAVFKGAKQKV